MKSFILTLSAIAFTQVAMADNSTAAHSLSLAQSCLSRDIQVVQTALPMQLERAFKNLSFKSEIFYQIVFNRVSLIENNLEFVSDYRKPYEAWNKKLSERNSLMYANRDENKLTSEQKQAYEDLFLRYSDEANAFGYRKFKGRFGSFFIVEV